MIKKLWSNINHKWYRNQYQKVSRAFVVADYFALMLMVAIVVWSNLTGGIVIGSFKDSVMRGVTLSCFLAIIICTVIVTTLTVVDGYERKLSEGK